MKLWYRLLSFLYLMIGAGNLIRGALAPSVVPSLSPWGPSLPLGALGGMYLLWGVLFVGLGLALWMGGGLRLALPFALAYEAVIWLLHLVGDRSPFARQLWGRDAVLTVLFIVGVALLSRWARGKRE